MNMGIASIGFNRPEMQEYCLETLAECRGSEKYPVHMFIDGGDTREKQVKRIVSKLHNSFPYMEAFIRAERVGLSRNILDAWQFMFDRYDVVCMLEDDLVLSRDFLEYHEIIQSTADMSTVFAVTAHWKVGSQGHSESDLFMGTSYNPDGVVMRKEVWDKHVKRHVTEAYYADTRGTIDKFRSLVKLRRPRMEKEFWLNDRVRRPAQAGLLNVIMCSLGMHCVRPYHSRVQDIGSYGHHQRNKTNTGEDIRSPEFWKKAGWHAVTFKDDHKCAEFNFVER